jgi:hypothetical protein
VRAWRRGSTEGERSVWTLESSERMRDIVDCSVFGRALDFGKGWGRVGGGVDASGEVEDGGGWGRGSAVPMRAIVEFSWRW